MFCNGLFEIMSGSAFVERYVIEVAVRLEKAFSAAYQSTLSSRPVNLMEEAGLIEYPEDEGTWSGSRS